MEGIRLGMVVRCERDLARGLASQTHNLWRHLRPDHTLVVVMDDEDAYPQDPSQYAGPSVIVSPRSQLTDEIFATFARRVDVVLGCETLYLDSAPDDIRAAGARSIIQANYELLYWGTKPWLPRPDLYLAPSLWNIDQWPRPVAYLPTPITREDFPFVLHTRADTFLHVAGHRALADRAGTSLIAQAARLFPPSVHLIVRSQTPISESLFADAACPVTIESGTVPIADLYAKADVLISPRRYGGQHLVAQEAASLGLPIICLDREPERSWFPGNPLLVPARPWQGVQMAVGPVDVLQCAPADLAKMVAEAHTNPDLVEIASRAPSCWAETLAWPTLLPAWRHVLQDVAAGRIPTGAPE